MHKSPKLISDLELREISGGFPWWEVPHLVMGTIEFINYSAQRWEHGCNHYEESDYVSKFICETCK